MKVLSSGHSFGEALEELKKGHCAARTGWNGKGMFLCYVAAAGIVYKDYPMLPWIGMKTADDCFVPWLASQTDVLSNDWDILVKE